MSLALQSNRIWIVGLLLLALLSVAAVRTSAVSASHLRQGIPHHVAEALVVITTAADVRSGPGDEYLMLTSAQPGEQFPLLGRSVDNRWWRIDFGGQPAWIPTASTRVQATVLVSTVAVGGAGRSE